MAVYTPPTETLPIFDNSVFPAADSTALTIANGRNYFLTYPVAQGEEIFPSNITLQSSVTDSTGSKGLATQVLSSTVTGTQWIYSGLNGYVSYAMSSLPLTLPTTVYSNLYVIFTGSGSGTLTIPISGFTTGTLLSIKNIASGTLNISTSSILFTATAVTTSLFNITSAKSISLYFNGTSWIQTTISDKVNELTVTGTLTTGSLSFTGAIQVDQLYQTATANPVELYASTTTSNIYLGGGNAAGPQHTTGPIIIGSDSTSTGGINIGTGTDLTTPALNTVNIGSATRGTIIKGTLTGDGGFTSASGNITTAGVGAISTTGTGSISTTSGSMSSGGIITGTSIVSPSYGPAADATDVSFCATQTGTINIGTAARTSSGKFINIGNGSGSTNQINIGVTTNTVSMAGVISTAIGTIAGKTAYFETPTNVIPATLDCTTVNSNVFMLFYSSSTPSNAITLNNIQDNQTLTFKNWSETSTPVTINFSTYGLYLYGTDNGTVSVASYSLPRGNSIVIQRISGKLYQINPNNNFPLGITSTTVSGTTSVSSPLISGTTSVTSPSLITTGSITLPTTTQTPSSTQLGYTNVITNAAAVGIGTGLSGTILTTGATLAIGIYMVNISLAETMNPNTTASSTTFAFTLTNTTLIGALSNNLYRLNCTGSSASTKYSFTFSVIAKVTVASGTVLLTGTNSASCNCSFDIGQAIMTFIKIA